MKIDYAVDVWPSGQRRFSARTYVQNGIREIDISLGKYQLLLSITTQRPTPSQVPLAWK